jgi:DNA repair protein RadA/Sms
MSEQRVAEAAKLGFEVCILPEVNKEHIKAAAGLKLIGVRNIQELMKLFMNKSGN